MTTTIGKNTLPFLALLAICIGCGRNIPDETVYYGPAVGADIVFYFKKGTTNDQVNYFLEHEIARPHSSGKGNWPLPGIGGWFRVITQDYEGYAITLRKNVTQEERDQIMSAIGNSPLIYKVFENVVPDEIVLDPAIAKKEQDEKEKVKNDNNSRKTLTSNAGTR